MSSRPPDWTRQSLSEELRARFLPILEAVARELLTHFAQPIDSVDPIASDRIRWSDPVALIGFAGPHAAGSLAIATPMTLLKATHPSGAGASEEDLLDWSREMANLFLGSFKLELIRRGVSIEMGLPATVIGTAIEIRCSGAKGIGLHVRTGEGSLDLFLDMALSPNAELSETPAALEGGPGDVLF